MSLDDYCKLLHENIKNAHEDGDYLRVEDLESSFRETLTLCANASEKELSEEIPFGY